MCEAAYTKSAVTDKHKIYGFTAAGGEYPTGEGVGGRRVTRGVPYAEEIEVVDNSVRIQECPASGTLVLCVSKTFVFLTQK